MRARFLWRALRARYRDQYAELAAIRSSVRPTDTVCDIGANKGSYTYWLSRWTPRGRVVAFEPQARLASYLTAARDGLGLRNVTIEASAVHAQTGTTTLYVPGSGESPGASLSPQVARLEPCRAVEVPVIRLDDYLRDDDRVGVLKVDVEGAERGVFDGAERTLADHSPLLVFECENRHLAEGSVGDVFRYLEELGYAGQFVSGRRLRPISEFDPALHQRQTGDRFWEAEDYHNNFVFRRA